MSPVRSAPAALTAGDADLRARYLAEVLPMLYPGIGTGDRDLLVVPHARRPRLLVPGGDRKLAAAAVLRYSEPQSRVARWKRDAVVTALRTGVSRLVLRDRIRVASAESIEAHLSEALGEPVR